MMDEKSTDSDKSVEDFMLPGFRFHPTDEELVEFYLKRKLQNRSLAIELIKQVDIYKYDPWDLPKLASTGEKEWYFYCPRDRKYRNSTRPNRVTGSGFWKATGTDRPIYSSEANKCIGLKKSLVFYRGRAAKGMKTDWMMHEFRLPAAADGGAPPSQPPKRIIDKNIPPSVSPFPSTCIQFPPSLSNRGGLAKSITSDVQSHRALDFPKSNGYVYKQDSWAICRIFKKTNSMANRALSHSWAAASLSETSSPPEAFAYAHFNSESDFQHTNFSSLNFPSYKTFSATKPATLISSNGDYFPENLVFSPPKQVSDTSNKSTLDFNSMIFNLSPNETCKLSESIDFEAPQHDFNNSYSVSSTQLIQASLNGQDNQEGFKKNQSTTNLWENVRSIGFPFSLPPAVPDPWKPNQPWDSPSEISSTNYSTNKCYL